MTKVARETLLQMYGRSGQFEKRARTPLHRAQILTNSATKRRGFEKNPVWGNLLAVLQQSRESVEAEGSRARESVVALPKEVRTSGYGSTSRRRLRYSELINPTAPGVGVGVGVSAAMRSVQTAVCGTVSPQIDQLESSSPSRKFEAASRCPERFSSGILSSMRTIMLSRYCLAKNSR